MAAAAVQKKKKKKKKKKQLLLVTYTLYALASTETAAGPDCSSARTSGSVWLFEPRIPSIFANACALAWLQLVIPRQPVMFGSEWFASGAS